MFPDLPSSEAFKISSSPNKDNEASSSSSLSMWSYNLREMLSSLKMDVWLLIQERARAMTKDKQVFISSNLQDLHLHVSAIPRLHVLGLINPFSNFIIVYIDDVLIYSIFVEEHWKHLNRFIQTIKENGLSLSASKINLLQTKIRFLGYHIYQETITPTQRSFQFVDKFPNEIKDKKQLQHFLGSLNYVLEFLKDISQLCAQLRQRLKKNLVPWNEQHTKIVKTVKSRVKTLPCLSLANPEAFKIVETDASNIGYCGIFK